MGIASIKNKFSYNTRLLIALTMVFAAFTIILVVFQRQREKLYREDMLESRLRSYADLVAEALESDGVKSDSTRFYSIVSFLPEELRLTVISRQGSVMYESSELGAAELDSHQDRPEVQNALLKVEGNDIRKSITTGLTYYYYAKSYGSFLVRVALPYDVSLQKYMKADNIFLWFVLALFPLAFVTLFYLSNQFGKTVVLLRHFIQSAERGLVDYDHIEFPHSELGDVGTKILNKYKELEESNRLIAKERERLLRHFHYFEEGVAIFSPERKKVYANPIFLQYVNTILDEPTANVNSIWNHKAFAPIKEFLDLNGSARSITEEAPIFRFNLSAGSTYYAVQLLVYSDGSFEMTLSDVTRAEKNRKLKQEMSNNITHELRTPVSSIRGYIETLLECPNLSSERSRYFMERAHVQVVRLTDLIRDVALITKTEEAPETMPCEPINVRTLVEDIIMELQPKLQEHHMKAENSVPDKLMLNGNYSLVYSIFRNLFENSIRYSGEGTLVHAECYNEDSQFCYFRYYDTGKGVDEAHLPRLFERFYRVNEGRTRDAGGTGLGLSIVRNAVLFHQGNITVRNRKEGGLEFLFTLKKEH